MAGLIKNFLTLSSIFDGPLKFFCVSHQLVLIHLFLRKLASLDTNQQIIFTCQSPNVAGVALDVIGNRLVQLLYCHIITGDILLLP